MTHEELRDKLLDYYGSATGIMPPEAIKTYSC